MPFFLFLFTAKPLQTSHLQHPAALLLLSDTLAPCLYVPPLDKTLPSLTR